MQSRSRLEQLSQDGGTAAAPEPGMSLAGIPSEPGGAGGGGGAGGEADLKQSAGPWTSAAGAVVELQSDTNAGLTQLGNAHQGVQENTEGLETTAALSAVLFSWQERLKSVRDEAGSLEPALRQVAKDHGEMERGLRAQFAAVTPSPTQDKGGR
ncbi:hypothetical protein AB0A60_18245 [Streptomyces sp. NPDC046275]|uniref:hypothetical protein n=1 Tax=Streptomyces sp. NPDC046275 TaxID=3157201 RepID=UPI003408F70C